jgi:hypothetical protein
VYPQTVHMSISQRRKGSGIKRMGVHILLASSMLFSSPKLGFSRKNGMLAEYSLVNGSNSPVSRPLSITNTKFLVSRVLSFYLATPSKKSSNSSL